MKKKLGLMLLALNAAVLVLCGLAQAAEEPAKVAGKWKLTWHGRWDEQSGEVTATLTLEQDGTKLKGALTGPRGRETPITGTIRGNSIKFSVTRQTPRGDIILTYTGTVEGDTMKGAVKSRRASRDWSAKREK